MQKQILKSIVVLIGTILFDFLFFKQLPGLNVLLITVFFEGALFYFYRESFSHRHVQLVAVGTFILAVCVVLTNSILANLAFMLSFSFLVGLTQLPELRFLFFGSALFAANFMEVPKHFANALSELPISGINTTRIKVYLFPIFMSFIIGNIFFFIYFIANPRFAEAARRFFDFFSNIFNFNFDFGHIVFFGLCFFICGATLWKHRLFDFRKLENNSNDFNAAENSEVKQNIETTNSNDFDAGKLGVIVLATINVLLLLNNLTDIPFVWFSKHSNFSPAEMKSFVHEGTYLLIFGILLAMCILLWLYRENKQQTPDNAQITFNKNPSSSMLDTLSKAWLIQNTFLAFSVGMRNTHYINAFGLAYKRIGVIFFLFLVLCCLWFLYLKIKNSETFFRFVTRNAWSFYAVLAATSCIPWDTFITDYNIKNAPAKDLDVRFLLNNISDKNTYQLIQNRNYLLESAVKSDVSLMNGDTFFRPQPDSKIVASEFDEQLAKKIARLKRRLAHTDSRSWNYPDYVNKEFLQQTAK